MFDRYAHMAKAMYGARTSGSLLLLLQAVNEMLSDGSITVGEALTFLGVAAGVAGATGKVVYRVTNSNVTPSRNAS